MALDEMFYLRIQVTVIDKIFVPTYATLSVGYNEIELYAIITKKFALPVSYYFQQNWKRFLDDCLIKPNELLDVLNNVNPVIQFTMETSHTQLPLLDIMINKEGRKLFMDIYSKTTDLKRYVSFKSNHPKHCLKNISFSFTCKTYRITEKDSLKEIN